jgi:pimeloyl-ACP methyl ester carboxylesterase
LLWLPALAVAAAAAAVLPGYIVLIAERGERPRFSAPGLATLCREVGAHVFFIALKPLGWTRGAVQRSSGPHDVPVVLVPGFAMNRSCMSLIALALRRRGWRATRTVNNGVRGTVPLYARRLADRVDDVLRETGAQRVDLVVHSMGGLIAGWYLQELGGADRVRRLVTLGTPWGGTKMAVFRGPLTEGDDLLPTSHVVQTLGAPPVPTTVVWSPSDHLVVPTASGAPDWADAAPNRSVQIEHLGHLEMCLSPRVIERVVDALSDGAASTDPTARGGEE